MLQSRLFSKTTKTKPKDAVSVNAELLERGGFVYKNSAGVYSFLPLGLRVLGKISQIIREEMNALGAQEMLLPTLVEKKYLQATGRWNVDVAFRARGVSEKEENFVLGWSHEDILTELVSHQVKSYKDLPFAVYQIQNKFRNEPRAKSGILRGREFLMKDLYSFHTDEKDFSKFYNNVALAYEKTFKRMGLDTTYTLSGGSVFTASQTHEFQVLSPVGEDTILLCDKCKYAENIEISKMKKGQKCPKCSGKVSEEKAIEVGNIFPLGTIYSKAFNWQFVDQKGKKQPVIMGSYGIGVSRAMGTIVEIHHDDKGIIWPESVAPFQVHLLDLGNATAKEIYQDLQKQGFEVLYDDREVSAGEKLVDSDLLGIPWRFVVSEKTKDKVEIKRRDSKEAELMSLRDFLKKVKNA